MAAKVVKEDKDAAAKKEVSSDEDLANKIESGARLFFPLAYAIFLILYFGYYLNQY